MKTRTQARIYAFKFLYRLQLENENDLKAQLLSGVANNSLSSLESAIEHFESTYENLDPDEEGKSFLEARNVAKELIIGTLKHYDDIARIISENIGKWTLEKLARIDLTILFLSTFEMKVEGITPIPVVIDEAIELAKKYGDSSSKGFINGTLENIKKA